MIEYKHELLYSLVFPVICNPSVKLNHMETHWAWNEKKGRCGMACCEGVTVMGQCDPHRHIALIRKNRAVPKMKYGNRACFITQLLEQKKMLFNKVPIMYEYLSHFHCKQMLKNFKRLRYLVSKHAPCNRKYSRLMPNKYVA